MKNQKTDTVPCEIYFDPIFKKIRDRKAKWFIPAHLKLALEESIKRGLVKK